jgi:hypothetical protein
MLARKTIQVYAAKHSSIMIDDTIKKIEARIKTAEAIKGERRAEILGLLDSLKGEVASLARTHGEQAQSIASFAHLSTQEATRTTQDPNLLKLSLEGLNTSVEGFEKTHPRLVQLVNAISSTLSNLGI